MAKKVYIGIDPGFSGGITIIDGKKVIVHDIPTYKTITSTKKTKQHYDLDEIIDIFEQYLDRDVECALESVSVMPGEGSVSSFNFGKGIGQLEMGIVFAGFHFNSVTPQKWKKNFPNLITPDILALKDEQKEIRKKNKELSLKEKDTKETNKKLKDKDKKSQNKKIIAALKKEQKDNKNKIAKLGRQVKSIAKNNARKEAALLCPKLSDSFSRKKDDGRAESLLIAFYIKG
jgi:hypothetical protein